MSGHQNDASPSTKSSFMAQEIPKMKNDSLALVQRKPDHELALLDGAIVIPSRVDDVSENFMESDVMTLFIGPLEKKFTIHVNLITAVSPYFERVYNKRDGDTRLIMSREDPGVFNLLVQSLYARRVPPVTPGMSETEKAKHLLKLLQLYVFADRLHFNFEFLNKTMDKIQDGYLISKCFPSLSTTMEVFKHSQYPSLLRKFIIHTIVHQIRIQDRSKARELNELVVPLLANPEIAAEFLDAVQVHVRGEDPRIRDCHGEVNTCLECSGNENRLKTVKGVWPCTYHHHVGKLLNGTQYSLESEGGKAGVKFVEERCYLWSTGVHISSLIKEENTAMGGY